MTEHISKDVADEFRKAMKKRKSRKKKKKGKKGKGMGKKKKKKWENKVIYLSQLFKFFWLFFINIIFLHNKHL